MLCALTNSKAAQTLRVHGATMTVLLLLLLDVHLVVCVSLSPPTNVSITSLNMEHTLHFQPGDVTPRDARFTVHVLNSRKSSWRPVAACVKLKAGQTCNLTRVFRSMLDHYQVRVQAFTPNQTSAWTQSAWFQPLSHTVLGPPDVSVSGCGDCLKLKFRLSSARLRDVYRRLEVRVRRSRDGAQFSLRLPYQEETLISYLQRGVEYCVTVSGSSFVNSNSVSSRPHCVFTSPPPTGTSLSLVFSLLAVFCVLVLVGLVVFSGPQRQRLRSTLSSLLVWCQNWWKKNHQTFRSEFNWAAT